MTLKRRTLLGFIGAAAIASKTALSQQTVAQLPTTPPAADEFDNAADIQTISAYQDVLEKLAEQIAEKDGGRFTPERILEDRIDMWERAILNALKKNQASVKLDLDLSQELDLSKYTVQSIRVNYASILDLKNKVTTPVTKYDGRKTYEIKPTSAAPASANKP